MENAIGAVCYCHGSVLFADLADATGPFVAVFLAAMGNRRQIVMVNWRVLRIKMALRLCHHWGNPPFCAIYDSVAAGGMMVIWGYRA